MYKTKYYKYEYNNKALSVDIRANIHVVHDNGKVYLLFVDVLSAWGYKGVANHSIRGPIKDLCENLFVRWPDDTIPHWRRYIILNNLKKSSDALVQKNKKRKKIMRAFNRWITALVANDPDIAAAQTQEDVQKELLVRAENFLKACKDCDLLFGVDYNGHIIITGDARLSAQAQGMLDRSPELEETVKAKLLAQACAAVEDSKDSKSESKTPNQPEQDVNQLSFPFEQKAEQIEVSENALKLALAIENILNKK